MQRLVTLEPPAFRRTRGRSNRCHAIRRQYAAICAQLAPMDAWYAVPWKPPAHWIGHEEARRELRGRPDGYQQLMQEMATGRQARLPKLGFDEASWTRATSCDASMSACSCSGHLDEHNIRPALGLDEHLIGIGHNPDRPVAPSDRNGRTQHRLRSSHKRKLRNDRPTLNRGETRD
jgi:hypothetical protein